VVAADQWTEELLNAGKEAHKNGTPFEFVASTNACKAVQDFDPQKHTLEDLLKDKRVKRSPYYEEKLRKEALRKTNGVSRTKTSALTSNKNFFAALICFEDAVEKRETKLSKQRDCQSKLRDIRASKTVASKTVDASEKIAAADNDAGRIVTATTVPTDTRLLEKMGDLHLKSAERQEKFEDELILQKKVTNDILKTQVAHGQEIEDLGHGLNLLEGRVQLTEAKQQTAEDDVDELHRLQGETEDKTSDLAKVARFIAQADVKKMTPKDAERYKNGYAKITGRRLSDASSNDSSSIVGRNSDASDESCFGGKAVNDVPSPPPNAAEGGGRSWFWAKKD